jgi:4-hydroxythreonine-4-phosphate dehydrogenase
VEEIIVAPEARTRPTIALAIGDPAGISPELTARVLADREVRDAATFIVVGDRRVLAEGTRIAGVALDIPVIAAGEPLPNDLPGAVLVDRDDLDIGQVERGRATALGGGSALGNFQAALTLATSGRADAVCYTPFNKQAMKEAYPPYEDEIVFTAEFLGIETAASEFNVLEEVWNARVTSHVPLGQVASLITRERILRGLRATHMAMRDAGFEAPRIAVAALNPHAGEGGAFGREEIEVIGPAVTAGRAEGILCDGPFPSDTVFVRAVRAKQFDAVLTMFHDQGQIAMKLIGFDRGVTLLGGFPFPIATPAHGTAYDIAGQGKGDPGATKQALLLAARMAAARLAA